MKVNINPLATGGGFAMIIDPSPPRDNTLYELKANLSLVWSGWYHKDDNALREATHWVGQHGVTGQEYLLRCKRPGLIRDVAIIPGHVKREVSA